MQTEDFDVLIDQAASTTALLECTAHADAGHAGTVTHHLRSMRRKVCWPYERRRARVFPDICHDID